MASIHICLAWSCICINTLGAPHLLIQLQQSVSSLYSLSFFPIPKHFRFLLYYPIPSSIPMNMVRAILLLATISPLVNAAALPRVEIRASSNSSSFNSTLGNVTIFATVSLEWYSMSNAKADLITRVELLPARAVPILRLQDTPSEAQPSRLSSMLSPSS